MTSEDIHGIVNALAGDYRLSLREKLPLVIFVTPIATLSIAFAALSFNHTAQSTKSLLVASGLLFWGLFLFSLALIWWSGGCYINETRVGFAAFPPFLNWRLPTDQIAEIRLMKFDGGIHLQFQGKGKKRPLSFLFSSRELQTKIGKLWQVNE